jgi:murein DD-endopeptidase MepM/ murein hydrolase activator NlpD
MSEPAYCTNEDPDLFSVTYFSEGDPEREVNLRAGWQFFNRPDPATGRTHKIWCRATNPCLEVAVDHRLPPGGASGRYRIETFVPASHSNTRRAIFSIVDGLEVQSGQVSLKETVAVLDMADLHDVWQPLGEVYLNPSAGPLLGRVRQYDISLEDPAVEASYGPVRWIPLFGAPSAQRRCDSPVGTAEERSGAFPPGGSAFGKYPVWAGLWFDFNPFLNWYAWGYHTGADLNLPGSSGADAGKPIYAIADGRVTYAGKAGTWGSIVVIEHEGLQVRLPDGTPQQGTVFSRYGHVEAEIPIRAGQDVQRGQQIAAIGLAAGAVSGWHLHFDVCYTDMLKRRPAHWPNQDTVRRARAAGRNSRAYKSAQAAVMREVLAHYTDPLLFIKDNHG